MIKNYNQYIKESLLDKLKGPTRDEINDYGRSRVKGMSYHNMLSKSLKIGYFDGVKTALDSVTSNSSQGDGINMYYVELEYLNNFTEEEQLYIINKFIKYNYISHLFEKCVEGDNITGVKFALDYKIEDYDSEKFYSKNKEFLEEKNYHILKMFTKTVENNNYEMVKLLLDNMTIIDNITKDVMEKAVITQNIKIIKLLIDRGVDFHGYDFAEHLGTKTEESLSIAIKLKNLEIVKILVEAGADIHTKNEHMIDIACYEGNFEIVKYLVSKGANVHGGFPYKSDIRDEYPIGISLHLGKYDQAKFLLEKGADLNNAKYSFINNQLKTGSPSMKELINKYIKKDE